MIQNANNLLMWLDSEAAIWPLSTISSSGQSAFIKTKQKKRLSLYNVYKIHFKKDIKSLWLFPAQSKSLLWSIPAVTDGRTLVEGPEGK